MVFVQRATAVCTVVLERYLDVLGGGPVGAWERSLLTGEGIPRVRLPHCPALLTLLAPCTFQVDSAIRTSHILLYVQTQTGAFTFGVLISASRCAKHWPEVLFIRYCCRRAQSYPKLELRWGAPGKRSKKYPPR